MTDISLSETFPTLSRRQREVCAMLIQGKSNKEVGRSLGISDRTVEDHRTEIYRRTGLSSLLAVAYRAYGEPTVRP